MKKTWMVMLVLALGAGNASAEVLTGKFLFHSPDGKVIGLKMDAGLAALVDGPTIQVNGVSSLEKLKPCDEVEVIYDSNGRQGVVLAVTLKKAAESNACELQNKPVPVAELKRALADKSATVLDVRSADEHAKGHLAGSVNIPLGDLEFRAMEIPREKPVIIYCHSGQRAVFAAKMLGDMGFRASFVSGKFSSKNGKPIITE